MKRRSLLVSAIAAPFLALFADNASANSKDSGVKFIKEYRLCSDTVVREYEWPDNMPIAFDYSSDGIDSPYHIQVPTYCTRDCGTG